MSETLLKIRARFKEARLARDTDTSTFLSTLIGDIESNAKLVDGEKKVYEFDVIATLNSFKKKNTEFVAMTKAAGTPVKVLMERDLIDSFLPQQMTDTQILTIINTEPLIHADMGVVMRFFKENYNGMYDGKTLSALVKQRSE